MGWVWLLIIDTEHDTYLRPNRPKVRSYYTRIYMYTNLCTPQSFSIDSTCKNSNGMEASNSSPHSIESKTCNYTCTTIILFGRSRHELTVGGRVTVRVGSGALALGNRLSARYSAAHLSIALLHTLSFPLFDSSLHTLMIHCELFT